MSALKQSHFLTTEQRGLIVRLNNEGKSQNFIQNQMEIEHGRTVHRVTITRICQKEKETNTVEDKPRSGRPRIYNDTEERWIVRQAVKNNEMSLQDLAMEEEINPKGASPNTINRILWSHKISTIVCPKRIDDLSIQNIKDRKVFANNYLQWSKSDWDLVIFSDESDLLPTKCGRKYLRLREGQKLVEAMPIRKGSKKLLTVKVWGMVSSLGVGPLVRYNDTMDGDKYLKLLQRYLFQVYPQLENAIIMENDPNCGLPAWILTWKNEKGIQSLKGPSNSPDLNIIENLWAYLEDQLYQSKEELTCEDDTWERACQIWYNIPMTLIDILYNDLSNRISKLKKMKGGPLA